MPGTMASNDPSTKPGDILKGVRVIINSLQR